jgi:hypothetical protein
MGKHNTRNMQFLIVFPLLLQLSNMAIIIGSIFYGLFKHFFTFTLLIPETIKWIFIHLQFCCTVEIKLINHDCNVFVSFAPTGISMMHFSTWDI